MDPHTFLRGRSLVRLGLRCLVAGLISTAFVASAAAEEPELPETPAEYEQFVLKHNPQLREEYERWQARVAEAKADSARWPQPRVSYTVMPRVTGITAPGLAHRATVSQTLPWPGVLGAAGEPARQRAEAIRTRYPDEAKELLFEVRQTLVAIARVDALREVLSEQRSIYREARGIVEQLIATGDADLSDVLRLSLAEETLGDRLDALEGERERQVAEMRSLLHLGPEAELTFNFEGDHDPLEVPNESPERRELIGAALEDHPRLQALSAEAAAASARAEYERDKRLPWLTVSLGAESMPPMVTDDRRNALMLGVSLPIPVFGTQYSLEEQRFEHERRAILEQRHHVAQHLVARIEKAVARIDEQRSRLERYRSELLPLADDITERILDQIATGEKAVTDYLLSFEQELALQTSLIEFRSTIATERARLEWLTSGAFTAHPGRRAADFDIRDAKNAPRKSTGTDKDKANE